MKRITSFTVDHTKMERGVYVSDKYATSSGVITAIDIRVKEPNCGMLSPESAHTIEHIGATYLRNEPTWKDRIVYFGPMGCMTGFYLVLAGDFDSAKVVELVRGMFVCISEYVGTIPGSSKEECGNYAFHDLAKAKEEAKEYATFLADIKQENLHYPR